MWAALAGAVAYALPNDPVLMDPVSRATLGLFDGPTPLAADPVRLAREAPKEAGAGWGAVSGASGWGAWAGPAPGIAAVRATGDLRTDADRARGGLGPAWTTEWGVALDGAFGVAARAGDRVAGAAVFGRLSRAHDDLTGPVTGPTDPPAGLAVDAPRRERGGSSTRGDSVTLVVGTGGTASARRGSVAFTARSSRSATAVDYRVGSRAGVSRRVGGESPGRRDDLLGLAWTRERGVPGDPDARAEGWLQVGLTRLAEPRLTVAEAVPGGGRVVTTTDRTAGAGPVGELRFTHWARLGDDVARLRVGPAATLGGWVLPDRGLAPGDATEPAQRAAWQGNVTAEVGLASAIDVALGPAVRLLAALRADASLGGGVVFGRSGDVDGTVSGRIGVATGAAFEVGRGPARAALSWAPTTGSAAVVGDATDSAVSPVQPLTWALSVIWRPGEAAP